MDPITQEIQELNVDAIDVPQTTVEAFKKLGKTAIATISSAISLVISQKLKELAEIVASKYENLEVISRLRTYANIIENYFEQLEAFQRNLELYLKYLDLFPEIKRPVMNLFVVVSELMGTLRRYNDYIKRVTYANDFLTTSISEAQDQIAEFLKLKAMLDKIYSKLE